MIIRKRCPEDEVGKKEYMNSKTKTWKYTGCYLTAPSTWTNEYYGEIIVPNVLEHCRLRNVAYVRKKKERDKRMNLC